MMSTLQSTNINDISRLLHTTEHKMYVQKEKIPKLSMLYHTKVLRRIWTYMTSNHHQLLLRTLALFIVT
jgi:hypothetical protein